MSDTSELLEQTEAAVEDQPEQVKLGSIRSNIFRRVLPVVLIPLLGLSTLAILGALVIQQRTTDAVDSAEEILNDQVVAAGAERTADIGSRELAEFIDSIVARVDNAAGDSQVAEPAIQASNELAAGNLAEAQEDGEFAAFVARNRIELDVDNVQVTLFTEDGDLLGSTHDASNFDAEAVSQWLVPLNQDGFSFRSFVNDGEHVPSFEFAVPVTDSPVIDGGALMRVRVPLSNTHSIADQLASEAEVDTGIFDSDAAVIIANTATQHDEAIVFTTEGFTNPESGLNIELMSDAAANIVDDEVVVSEELVTATASVGAAQSNERGIASTWVVQANQSADVAAESLSEIRQVQADVQEQQGIIFVAVGLLLLLALFFAFAAIRSIAGSITAPVTKLSEQARVAAEEGIPAVVEAARTSERLPELPAFEVDSNDELSQLASSLNTMQGAAVDLAAGQAKLRRQNVARTFVSLGRRNQNLLNRQLEFIDDLERQESDPDTLENLFRLDHLATRMRRNAENLLVLAGEQTPRRWGKPIAVRDVVRAAAAEIADYRRVKLGDIDSATVSGNIATDLAHLIAELLENAGSFSPPNTNIEVLGQLGSTHYRLAIVDQGIGMDERAMGEANDRLKNPVDFADAPSAYLGLFVVGRLSQDLGITVRLTSADPTGEGKRRGTIAFVDLPVRLLSSEEANPVDVSSRVTEAPVSTATPNEAEVFEAPTLTPASPVAPVVAPAAPVAAPAAPAAAPAAPVAEEAVGTTTAGFPQRRSRKGPEAHAAPETTIEQPGAAAGAQAPTEAAPVPEAPLTPVVETPAAVPTAPATPVTSAGFPKRRSKSAEETPAPTPDETPDEAEAPIRRDATAVSDSLRSFRAAVARGRQAGQGDQVSGASASPPPVPATPPATTTPTPSGVLPAPAATPAPQAPAPAPAPAPAHIAAPAPTAPAAPVVAAPAVAGAVAPIADAVPSTQVPPSTDPVAQVPSAQDSDAAPKMAPPVVDAAPAAAPIAQATTESPAEVPAAETPNTTGSES